MLKLLLGLVGLLLLSSTSLAAGASAATPTDNAQACRQGGLVQFGRYLGRWTMQASTLAQDGKSWQTGKNASWHFVCLGNGTAVQDYWQPEGGEVATNLRVYNAQENRWDVVWAVKDQPGFTRLQAHENEAGNIVMHVVDPVPDPLRRITFYPPTADGWRWTLEFSHDAGASWREVHRLVASPAGS